VQLYQRALADVTDPELEAAAVECLQRCTFWPTVAEVRTRCAPTRRGMQMRECEAAILRKHPEWATVEGQLAAQRGYELRTRAWRKRRDAPHPVLEPGPLPMGMHELATLLGKVVRREEAEYGR
jgi:hypothetical protein